MSPVDRVEHVEVDAQGRHTYRQEAVADVGAEQTEVVARIAQLVWLLVALVEVFIGIRVVLKLLAANPQNAFASFIYALSDVMLLPFLGITIAPGANGVVLDVPAIIGMLVYALFGWIVVRLIWLLFKPARRRSVRTYEEFD